MQKPLLLLLSAGCLISCHKEASNPVSIWTWFGKSNPAVYNYVLINANQVMNKADSTELHIGVSAAFIDSNNHQVTVVHALTVNNILIQPGLDSTYSYEYASAAIAKSTPLFGSQVQITIRGTDEGDTVSNSIYVPKQLESPITVYPDVISLSEGLQLNWTPDDENVWGNVIIQVFYYSQLSLKSDSTLPEKIATVDLTVSDNGKYFLTAGDLKTFPPHSVIGITIARGTQNEAILPLSRKRVYYFSSASISTTPVKLMQ